MHNLEYVARGITSNENANKTEFRCLKKDGAISTYTGKRRKFVDISYSNIDSNISSTKSRGISKALAAIDRLCIRRKSDLW